MTGMIQHSYTPGLVTLSVIIAMIASYTALDLAGRVAASHGRTRMFWILGGATAMGTGIWSMHFVGMLAFRLPMAVAYDAPQVALSVIVAVGASAFALWMISRHNVRQWHFALGALAMGAAIAGMHYVGMAAMVVAARLQYIDSLWWASIGIAVGASYVALNLAKLLSTGESRRILAFRAGAAVAMGFAIAGMHYTGMAAAQFTPIIHVTPGHAGELAPFGLAAAVAISGVLIAGLALLASMLDRIMQARTIEAELRAAKEAAEETTRHKSAFLSTMSHELRTPLNSVIGFAGIMKKNKAGNLTAQDLAYLDRIASNGSHLLELINGVLDLSKIEAGRVELERASVDLGRVVRDTLMVLEDQALSKGLTISADIPESLAPIETDPTKFKQMLINLVGNSIKFTAQGQVKVRVMADPVTRRPIRVDVVDSGIGIPADRLEAVFHAFQQADNSTSRLYGGTGLGLTITRSLARLMGFEIEVQSREGFGSTFSVMLQGHKQAPAIVAPSLIEASVHAAPATAAVRRSDDGAARRWLVLVIDDDPDARVVLGQHLEELGCDVVAAAGADEGMALARRLRPDLITIDVMMPRKTGIEALHEFKTDPVLRDIPVVVVSVVAEDHRGRVLGAVDCIAKPVTRQALETVLERNVATTRSRRVMVVQPGSHAPRDYQELFRQEEVRLDVVRTVDEARAHIDAQGAPSLFVLDVSDPSAEIFPYISAIRDDRRTLQVPLVVLVPDGIAKAASASLAGRATVLPRSQELSADLSGVIKGLRGRGSRVTAGV